jgi:hypothetical protein
MMIPEDGLSARLIYSLMGAGQPVIDLTLSGSATVTLSSNYLPKPLQIEVK